VGGAGGMIGSKRVADAAPDGYTVVLGTVGTHAQGQSLYKKPLYNAATDFTPVALIAEVPVPSSSYLRNCIKMTGPWSLSLEPHSRSAVELVAARGPSFQSIRA
jgi:hypothetical protein